MGVSAMTHNTAWCQRMTVDAPRCILSFVHSSFSYPPILYPHPPIAHSPRPTDRRAREQVHGYLSGLPGWLSTDKIWVNAAVPVPKSEHGHCQWSSCGRPHPGPLPTETHREPYRRPYTTLHRTPIFIRTTDLWSAKFVACGRQGIHKCAAEVSTERVDEEVRQDNTLRTVEYHPRLPSITSIDKTHRKPTASLQTDALMCIIRTSMSFPFLLRLCIGEDEVDSDFTLANLGRSTFGRRTSKFWDSTDFKRMMSSRENILTPEDSILVCKLHFLALSSVRAIYRCSDIGQMVRRSKVPSYKNITAKMEIPLTEFQFILDLVSHVQYVQVPK